MKRNTKLATILAAGTAAAVGGVLAAGPVAAAVGGNGGSGTSGGTSGYSRMMGGGYGGGSTGSRTGGTSMMGTGGSGYSSGYGMMGSGVTGTGTGYGMMGSGVTGTGTGYGMMGSGLTGMMGSGVTGTGTGVGMMGGIAVTAPSGTLTAAQQAALADVAAQQQLARDLYQAFATQYNSVVLDHVSIAAGYQLDAVRTLMTRYGITDPTAGRTAGTYSDPAVQTTYNSLLAQGKSGYDSALTALRSLETAQVAALTKDLSGLTAPDVQQVYTRLLSLAEMYQAMFA